MLGMFKKKPAGQLVTFKIDGMHCTSCSMNIDGELEDTDGVIGAQTSYANATTKVNYDPEKVDTEKLEAVIKSAGYSVKS